MIIISCQLVHCSPVQRAYKEMWTDWFRIGVRRRWSDVMTGSVRLCKSHDGVSPGAALTANSRKITANQSRSSIVWSKLSRFAWFGVEGCKIEGERWGVSFFWGGGGSVERGVWKKMVGRIAETDCLLSSRLSKVNQASNLCLSSL